MSRVSAEAACAYTATFGDSTEIYPPPLKKPKTEVEPKVCWEEKEEEEEEIPPIPRKAEWHDPEYTRQREMFDEQFEKSEGYDVEWDKLDYHFYAVKYEWAGDLGRHLSKKQLRELLIKTAIDEENEENGTKLEFVKYVSCNVMGVQGFLYYLTFWAKDVSSPNPEPKLYQAKVRKFCDQILVRDFRLRPTQE